MTQKKLLRKTKKSNDNIFSGKQNLLPTVRSVQKWYILYYTMRSENKENLLSIYLLSTRPQHLIWRKNDNRNHDTFIVCNYTTILLSWCYWWNTYVMICNSKIHISQVFSYVVHKKKTLGHQVGPPPSRPVFSNLALHYTANKFALLWGEAQLCLPHVYV